MNRWVIISFAAAIVLAFAIVEVLRPPTEERRPSFEHDVSAPFGGQILYEILPAMLEGAEVRVNSRSTYLYLRDTTRSGENYLILTSRLAADSLLTAQLLAYAARGNTVLLAVEQLVGPLADELDMRTNVRLGDPVTRSIAEDSVLHLVAPALRREGGYRFEEPVGRWHVARVDTGRTTALGFAGSDEEPLINYVRVGVGEGEILVLTSPLAFTNYHLLREDGAAYAAAALAYLPARPTVWDGLHKPLRQMDGSPLRYIHETPPLAFSYYTLLLGALLFVLLRGRRRQRPIPVLEPPRNQTVAFARAIGRLWHEHGDDRELAERRLNHLRHRIRAALQDPEVDLSPEHRDEIVRRLGILEEDFDAVLNLAARLQEKRRPEPKALIDLDRRLDRIHQHLY